MMRQPPDVVRRHDLSSLRATVTAGEPWNEDAWLWFFEHVCGRRIPILNYGSGTECARAFRRHAQDRRQTHRAGGDRVGAARIGTGCGGRSGRASRSDHGVGVGLRLRADSRRRKTANARREIAAVVATRFGAPYRPKRVLLLSALPKTRNEKIMRRIVRAVLSDTDLGDLSSLVNPAAIDELRAVAAAEGPTPT